MNGATERRTRGCTGRQAWAIAGVFLLALGCRLGYVLQIRSAPFFDLLIVDGRGYDAWASRLAGGAWLGDAVFYQAPLYPYLLGALYALFGRSLLLVRLVQSVLGAAGCVLVALAGRRLFGARAGLIAGVLLALYGPALFFDGVLQKASLGFFLMAVVLYLFSIAQCRPGRRVVLCLGLGSGLLALTRENALAFVPLFAAWPWVRCADAKRKRRLVTSAIYLLGVAAVLLPVAARNAAVGGEFHITTSQFGPNFYIGNNPDSDGMYKPLREGRGSPEFERTDATELAEAKLGRKLTPKEVSHYWTGRALSYIREQPGHWLKLMVRKLLLTWNAVESADAENLETYRQFSWLLTALSHVLHLGVLAPLAVAGIVLSRRDWRALWPLYALLALTTAGVALFFVFARYRFPLVPVLALFAGAGLSALWGAVRAGRYGRLLPAGAAALATAFVTNWPLLPEHPKEASTLMWYVLGSTLGRDGRHVEAVPFFRKALALDTNHVNARFDLANVLSKSGETAAAIREYRRLLEIRPNHAEARYNLANILADTGDEAGAIVQYQAAIQDKPGYAKAHYNLGNVLAGRADYVGAARHYRAALEADPGHTDARNNLGNVYMMQQRHAEAAREYEAVLRIAPGNATARRNLAAARAALDRPGR